MSHPGAAADGVTQTVFASWTLDPWVAAPLTLAAGIYLAGCGCTRGCRSVLALDVSQPFSAASRPSLWLWSRRCMPSGPNCSRHIWSSTYC